MLSFIFGEVVASSTGAELAQAEVAGEAGMLEVGPPATAGSVGGVLGAC